MYPSGSYQPLSFSGIFRYLRSYDNMKKDYSAVLMGHQDFALWIYDIKDFNCTL